MKYYDKFMERLQMFITDEECDLVKKKVYHDKKAYIELKISDIIKEQDHDFIMDVAFNKDEYLTTVCCQWNKLFTPLKPEQKLIVLVNIYCIYTLNRDGSRTYENAKSFLRILDEGHVERYWCSAIGHTYDYMKDLPDLNSSDVMYWLHHEWKQLSGDWFEKIKNKDFVSRNTTKFTARNYQAFNVIFKQCFGRDLKCYWKFEKITLLDEFKQALEQCEEEFKQSHTYTNTDKS